MTEQQLRPRTTPGRRRRSVVAIDQLGFPKNGRFVVKAHSMTQPIDTTVEDTEIDLRIIEALVHPEQDLLNALYRSGVTVETVTARAARLSLTNEFIKRCRLTGTQPGMRRCVKCDARFLSAGPQNRLCRKCPPR
jgi:hypothetical protein